METEIATLSISLTQKPFFKTKECLDKLYEICKNKETNIAQKAIKSVMIVLIDILPSYSVGKHAVKENLSKDVRERREFEKTLLDFTRRFIQFCEASAFNRQNAMKIRAASARGLSFLYSARPDFNTGDHLAKVIVRLACCPAPRLRSIACSKITEVFNSDPNGEHTLKIMTHLAGTTTNQISVEMLQTLTTIKLKSSFENNKPKKEHKVEDKELEKQLKHADIIDNKNQRQKNQQGILEHLFGTVFRFLKETKSEQHYLVAMNVVHDFVEFINIDVIPAILDALKQKRFSLRAAITSATTASSVCNAANHRVDLRDFYSSVYARCYEALDDRAALLELLNLFDWIGKDIDKSRTSSFAKRLMVMTLHAQAPVAATVIAHIRQIFSKDPGMAGACAFDFEGEGEFSIEADDPDFCSGPSAKYWELAELVHTYNKELKDMATELSQLVDYQSVRENDISMAKEKRTLTPDTVLQMMDKNEAAAIWHLTPEQIDLPKEFKIFDFE